MPKVGEYAGIRHVAFEALRLLEDQIGPKTQYSKGEPLNWVPAAAVGECRIFACDFDPGRATLAIAMESLVSHIRKEIGLSAVWPREWLRHSTTTKAGTYVVNPKTGIWVEAWQISNSIRIQTGLTEGAD